MPRVMRRVGLALDRTGFTVEDRDRAQGLYFVRYVNPRFAGREEPTFFQRILSFGRKPGEDASPLRYRVKVTGEGAASSTVAVLDPEGKPAALHFTTRKYDALPSGRCHPTAPAAPVGRGRRADRRSATRPTRSWPPPAACSGS